MSGSEQSSQEGFDFESAISSGSVSEGSFIDAEPPSSNFRYAYKINNFCLFWPHFAYTCYCNYYEQAMWLALLCMFLSRVHFFVAISKESLNLLFSQHFQVLLK